jgi:hypothetical protein
MAESYAFLNRKDNYASERVTVSTTEIGGTVATINGTVGAFDPNQQKASACVVGAVTNGIFYTLDGTTPSSTNGKRLLVNEELPIAGYQKVRDFKAVRDGGVDAVIDISYYRG